VQRDQIYSEPCPVLSLFLNTITLVSCIPWQRYYCVHRILNYVPYPSPCITITHSVYSYFCISSVLHIRLLHLVVATFLGLLQQGHTLSPRWRHDKSLRRHSDNNSVHCCTARTGHEEDKEQH